MWMYDEILGQVKDGSFSVDEQHLISNYLEWLDDCNVVMLSDHQHGEVLRILSAKRGNVTYSAKYRHKMNQLSGQMKGLKFSNVIGRTHYQTMVLFFTFTYDRNKLTKQEAWNNLSKDIAKFKVQVKRDLKCSSLKTIMSKEGTEDGYPAPHMLLILDRPVFAYRHVGQRRKISYRIQNKNLVDLIKTRWKNGYVDLQAVIDDKVDMKSNVYHYLFKYLIKSVKMDDMSKLNQMIIKTNAWQKLFRMRAIHISKDFKNIVNRLDTDNHQSQHWEYLGNVKCSYDRVIRVMTMSFLDMKYEKSPIEMGLGEENSNKRGMIKYSKVGNDCHGN